PHFPRARCQRQMFASKLDDALDSRLVVDRSPTMKQFRTFFRRHGIIARRAGALLFLAVAVMASEEAGPDEGGVPLWTCGTYASFAAVPPDPGWYMPTQLYYYNGDASGTKNFQRGDAVVSGLNSKATVLIFFTPTWAPDEKWFGGQPSFSLTFGGGWNS